VAQADAMIYENGPHPGFPQVVAQARELHDSLLKSLLALEPDLPSKVSSIAAAVAQKIDELEDIVMLLRSPKH